MKNLVLASALIAVSAVLSIAAPLRIDIPEINKYYTDYNYVVAYSTPAEREQLARQAAGMKSASIPDSIRLKALRDLVKGLLDAEIDQDPQIVKGNRLADNFLYAKIPLAFRRVTPDNLTVQTVRRPVWTWWRDGVAGVPGSSPQRFNPRTTRGYSYSETDLWVRAAGTWHIASLHFYLVRNQGG
jgi:hypothetical protein